MDHVQVMRALAIQQLCSGYYGIHTRWPPLIFDGKVGPILTIAILNNWTVEDSRISSSYPPVEPEEWGLHSLDNAETFNWVESIIPILKDKATSPRGEYVGDYFAYMGGLVSPFKELSRKERNSVTNSTRLLLAYVLRSDLKKICKNFFTNTQRTLIL